MKGEHTGQQRSGDRMPGTGDGADDRGFRCGGELSGRCGQIGGKAGILHADFNGDRSLLRGIHADQLSSTVAKQIA